MNARRSSSPLLLLLLLTVSPLPPATGQSLGAQVEQREVEARTFGQDQARDLERWAGLRLRELEGVGEGEPRTLMAETERLWALYLLSVSDKERLEEAEALADDLRERVPEDGSGARSLGALDAALEVVRAKHSRWPPNKLKHLRAGVEALDRLVAEDPDDLRVRYLRLVSCFYLPFFLSREESVAADMEMLVDRLPREPDAFPPYLYRGVVWFLLDQGEMSAEARTRLEEAVR